MSYMNFTVNVASHTLIQHYNSFTHSVIESGCKIIIRHRCMLFQPRPSILDSQTQAGTEFSVTMTGLDLNIINSLGHYQGAHRRILDKYMVVQSMSRQMYKIVGQELWSKNRHKVK